jgi:hypothetical protein
MRCVSCSKCAHFVATHSGKTGGGGVEMERARRRCWMNAKAPRAPRESRQGSIGFASAYWGSYRSGGVALLGPFLRTKKWGSGVFAGKSGVRFFIFGWRGVALLDHCVGLGFWEEGSRPDFARGRRKRVLREQRRTPGSGRVWRGDRSRIGRNARWRDASLPFPPDSSPIEQSERGGRRPTMGRSFLPLEASRHKRTVCDRRKPVPPRGPQ